MRKLLTFAVLGLAVALVGCEKEGGAANTPAPGTSTGGGTATKDGKGLKMVFIPKSTGNAYFAVVDSGFEAACKEIGAECTMTGPAQADATSQIPIIKDQIQRGVDVIVVSANAPDTLNQVFDEAKAKGITVMTVDSDLTGNEAHRDASVMSPDAKSVGEGQLELLGSKIGYEGPIAILSAAVDAPNQNSWIAVIKDALKTPKYSKMKLVDVVFGNDDTQKSTTECEALLSKHPDLKGIISPTTMGLKAAAQTLKIAGVYPGGPKANGKGIVLVGLAGPSDAAGYIKDGVIPASQLWVAKDMGTVAAYAGEALHTGKVKPTDGASVDVPVLGKRTFGKNGVMPSGPVVTYDKSNIDKS